ncbi:MAG: hypothetical protein KAY37_05995 [Phycisphaerae bacterium]|nr:hypothetical protein [Phycisphaerae bacterium]
MRFRTANLLRLVGVAVLTLALLVTPARAEDDEEDRPFHEPGIRYKNESDYKTKPYIDWGCGVLIAVACLLIAFKNPHRSHLD